MKIFLSLVNLTNDVNFCFGKRHHNLKQDKENGLKVPYKRKVILYPEKRKIYKKELKENMTRLKINL